jgi:hypothetical protein
VEKTFLTPLNKLQPFLKYLSKNKIIINETKPIISILIKLLGLCEEDDEEDEEDEDEEDEDELPVNLCLIIILTFGNVVPELYKFVFNVKAPFSKVQETVRALLSTNALTLVIICFSIPFA